MQIKRLLLATDFSPQARHALGYAAELSARLDVPLLLVAAFQIPSYPLPEGAIIASQDTIAKLLEHTSRDLAAEVKHATELGAKGVDSVVIEGVAALEIVRLAKERSIDLIVMGSHGRGGLSRAILGSVADRVMRSAHCPVMIVTQTDDA
ncbi:MAG: universal stress protein [Kofleriaceae bacterium]